MVIIKNRCLPVHITTRNKQRPTPIVWLTDQSVLLSTIKKNIFRNIKKKKNHYSRKNCHCRGHYTILIRGISVSVITSPAGNASVCERNIPVYIMNVKLISEVNGVLAISFLNVEIYIDTHPYFY